MIDGSSLQSFKLNIINIASIRIGTEWDYTDVYGPFHRLLLVKKGEGLVRHHGQDFRLEEGVLHLVPAYTRSSYKCDSFLDQSYIHFSCELEKHLDFFMEVPFQYQIAANELDIALFQRLLDLNPGMELQDIDPKKYNKKLHFDRAQNYCSEVSPARFIESKSITLQLVSRFITDKTQPKTETQKDCLRIKNAVYYIRENIEQELTVKQLADMTYLNPDYFSRIFKQTMGVRPIEYIHRRRLQRVKLLLLTTEASVEKIGFQVGFSSQSYFLRIFKKYVGTTPAKYRKNAFYG
jgi:AraC family transcriptional regulator